MIIEGDRIKKIGRGDLEFHGEDIDLEGKLILPGLHDSHIHAYSYGRSKSRLDLKQTKSITELKEKLKFFKTGVEADWIIGHGWDQDEMEDQRYPTRHDLDEVEVDRPILLYRACNHIGVVNTKALEMMDIDENTGDPEGGQIDREEDGYPTGILREEGLTLVADHIAHLDDANRLDYYRKGIQICLEKGLTAIHTNDAQAWQYYSLLAENDELPIRVFLTLKYSDLDKDSYVPQFNENVGLLTCRRVKLFADGSLGAETAALRENYNGREHKGILIDTPAKLATKISRAHDEGYQLEVHAIGDYAAEVVMNGFEEAGIAKEDRGIITHCQILGEDLIQRMATNGWIANIQPPFVPTDSRWAERRLGNEKRLKYAYAWKSLLKHGVPIAGGSDAPIEDADPFYGIYCAINRPDPDGMTWRGEECLSMKEAVELYSSGGAYAVGQENQLGKLKEGYFADFVIVNPHILENNEELLQNPLYQVWVNGELKYHNSRYTE